ncbi:MAG: hypothetical protein ACK5T0_08585 [Vampirovibrionales bacterium]
MGTINTSSSSRPNFPINPNPNHLQAVQNVAQAQVDQQIQNVQEQSDSLAKKVTEFCVSLVTMQFMDEQASERLSYPEKGAAVGLGLVSLLAFTNIGNRLAGLDPTLGTINPLNKDAAKNSPVGRFARTIDGLTPEQGSLKNLPTWMRAYLGDLPADEYNRYWLENHEHAVNATANKLKKGITPASDSLVERYIAHYNDLHKTLKEATKHHDYYDRFEKIMTPEQQKHITSSLMNPFFEADAHAFLNEGKGNKALDKNLHHHFKAVFDEALAKAQASGSPEAMANFLKVEGLGIFQGNKTPEYITQFDDFIKQRPQQMKAILEGASGDSDAVKQLQKAVIAYVNEVNPPSVKHAYLHQVHSELYKGNDRWFWTPEHVNIATAKAMTPAEIKALEHNPHLLQVKDLQGSISRLKMVGDKNLVLPFSRQFSKLSTSEADLVELKSKALQEIKSKQAHWEGLLGKEAVAKHMEALDPLKKMSVDDFFKLNGDFSNHAQKSLKSFKKLHDVLPRSIQRLMQNISEHEQFIHHQKELSDAWGVSGLGRGVASVWRGVIDLAKFALHETPEEVLKNKAMAMSDLRKGVSNPVISTLKSLGNFKYLGFFLGAVTAFSTGWAAFMAAGKTSKAKATPASQATVQVNAQATAQTKDAKNAKTAQAKTAQTAQARDSAEKPFVLGEQLKAGFRAALGIALPMVGAHQLIMFLNRGNRLGKLMGGHYLTSLKFPFAVAGFHWLTGAGAIITLGNLFLVQNKIRKGAEDLQDKTVGKPTYLVEYEEREKAMTALRKIKAREFGDIKKEDIALIAKYPEASKKEKITLTPAQIEEAYRLAGTKKVRDIDPKEAALLYALAQEAKNPSASQAPSVPKQLTPQEAALLYALTQQPPTQKKAV